MPKRILLLTASYGTGHNSAVKALAQAILERCPDAVLKTIDVTKLDGESGGPLLSQKLYNWSMLKPRLWDLAFWSSTNAAFSAALRRYVRILYYRAAEKALDEFRPDAAVAAYPYWGIILETYARRRKRVPALCVVTDSTVIHHSWYGTGADRYCVMDDDTRAIVSAHVKVPVEATGFPVNPLLEAPADRAALLRELGLDPDRRTVLVSVGLGAVDKFRAILEHLREQSGPFQTLVVCGKFTELCDELKTWKFREPCAVLGWTDRMPDWLRACDLVVCKGGGGIVSESLAAGKPVFIPAFVPGQERGNVEFIRKHGLGFYEPELDGALPALDRILSGDVPLPPYAGRIRAAVPHGAARRIAELALGLCTDA